MGNSTNLFDNTANESLVVTWNYCGDRTKRFILRQWQAYLVGHPIYIEEDTVRGVVATPLTHSSLTQLFVLFDNTKHCDPVLSVEPLVA